MLSKWLNGPVGYDGEQQWSTTICLFNNENATCTLHDCCFAGEASFTVTVLGQ